MPCSYFKNFSSEDGYENVGDAFEKFFSRPKWEFDVGARSGIGYYPIVYFTGVGKYQGSNALYKVTFWARYFMVGPFQFSMIENECTINGRKVNPMEILAMIYLN